MPTLVPTSITINLVHAAPVYFFKTHLILSSHLQLRLPSGHFLLVSHQNLVCIYLLLHTCHMLSPSHSPWKVGPIYDVPKNSGKTKSISWETCVWETGLLSTLCTLCTVCTVCTRSAVQSLAANMPTATAVAGYVWLTCDTVLVHVAILKSASTSRLAIIRWGIFCLPGC
jgi:hypothetical protein